MKLPTRRHKLVEAIILALMATVMYVSQVLMAPLPNIELVSFLIIITARRFGFKSLLSVYIFSTLQIFTYGFHIWSINYLYVWAILAIIVILTRKIKSMVFYTIVSGLFGLLFGTLCAIPYFITEGFAFGVGWIMAGLRFDLYHFAGNLVLTAILFVPITKAFNSILDKTLK